MPANTVAMPIADRPLNRKHRCRSGDGCTKYAVECTMLPGRFLFCRGHQEQIDRSRLELQEQKHQRSHRNKANATEVFCERGGCTNRPIYGSDFCFEHTMTDD